MYIAAKRSPEESLVLDQLLMLHLQLCFKDVKATTDVFCKEHLSHKQLIKII